MSNKESFKRHSEEQKEGYKLLTNLARLVPGVIYQYRLYPDGSSAFPYSSPGMYDIYEVTPEEVQKDASVVFGRLHPEDYDMVSEAIFDSAQTLETFYCEFRVLLPKQGLRWRWSQAQPERMADGSILWHGIIVDITDRRIAEDERKRAMSAIEYATDSIIITNVEGNIEYVNPAFEKVTGYSTEEVVGQNPRILKSDEHDVTFYQEMWQTLLSGKPGKEG